MISARSRSPVHRCTLFAIICFCLVYLPVGCRTDGWFMCFGQVKLIYVVIIRPSLSSFFCCCVRQPSSRRPPIICIYANEPLIEWQSWFWRSSDRNVKRINPNEMNKMRLIQWMKCQKKNEPKYFIFVGAVWKVRHWRLVGIHQSSQSALVFVGKNVCAPFFFSDLEMTRTLATAFSPRAPLTLYLFWAAKYLIDFQINCN